MVQNYKFGEAVGTIARTIGERAELLRSNGCDPQQLVDALGLLNYELLSCIDPDELEQQQ